MHIQLFGEEQFVSIPREVGGGKPEKAYLKLSPQNQDFAKELGLPLITNLANTTNIFGPVAVLFRSDTSLLFVNYIDFRLPFDPTRSQLSATNRITADNIVKGTQETLPKQIRADLVNAVIYAK